MEYKKREPWVCKEITILKKYFPVETSAKVGKRLKKSPGAIVQKARRLGLCKILRRKDQKLWVRKEVAILKKYYPVETIAKVAERLQRSTTSVFMKAYNLGLRKRAMRKRAR